MCIYNSILLVRRLKQGLQGELWTEENYLENE